MEGYYETIGGDIKSVTPEFVNPMVKAYGQYFIRDIKCKTCKFFIKKSFGKNYYKCTFRGNTNGPATDHRINWPACSKFIKK